MIRSFPIILSIVSAGMLVQCAEDEPAASGEANTSATLAWVEGYPKARIGSKSLDIDVMTTKNAEVSYLLSDLPLALTPEQLKNEVALPTIPSLKAHGKFNVSANQETKEMISGLIEQKIYNLYILMSNGSDTSGTNTIFSQQVEMKVRHAVIPFFSASENRTADLLVYRPEDVLKYPENKHPVIYYLAGDGEITRPDLGRPINLMRNGTLSHYIGKGNDVPLMVVAIQHSTAEWNLELITEAIKFSKENLSVDQAKQYLVGTSAGAFGCWDYAVAHPEEFAAISPMSGGGKNNLACNLKNMAVWGFHNQQDDKVGPIRTISMINDILACGPTKEVKITLFPDLGHNSWRRVFDPNHVDWALSPDIPRVDLYNWLLQFKNDSI